MEKAASKQKKELNESGLQLKKIKKIEIDTYVDSKKHFLKKILSIINLFILLIFMLLLQPEKESFQVSPENPATNFSGYINF